MCLKPTKTRASQYNCEKPIQLLGKFETAVENNNKITVTTIYVAAGKSGCLLKSKTAEEFGFITVHVNIIDTDHQTLVSVNYIYMHCYKSKFFCSFGFQQTP